MKLHEMGPKAILHPKNVTFCVNELDNLGLLEFVDETPKGSNKFYFIGSWKPTQLALNGTRVLESQVTRPYNKKEYIL